MRSPFLKFSFFLISLIVLVGLACGPSGRIDPTATPVAPVQQVEVETLAPTDTSVPEPTPTNTTAPTPTLTVSPPENDTEEDSEEDFADDFADDFEDDNYAEPQAYFTEEFDGDLSSWSYFLMSGDETKMDLFNENSYLVFDLQGEDQYVYVLYDEYIYPEVRIDVLAENRGKNTNNVSLICNYSERFGWYEFNITNGGLYYILAYSELDGEYARLISGGSTNIRTGRDQNWYTAVCIGNKLELYINGVLEKEHVDNIYNLTEGQVGISVSSFDVLPILVEIDYFSISLP